MPLLAASLAIALFFSEFSASQVSNVTWPSCQPSWKWSFNSLGQDPCEVTAYMLSTCNGGSFPLSTLDPNDSSYGGPDYTDASNLCECSTVGYSLVSACGGCQGHTWITWSEFTANCTRTLPPSSFPNPIPSEIRVPHWALLDVTTENDWDFNKSYAAGDSPELGPGTIPGPSGTSVTGSSTTNNAASSTVVSNTATPTPVRGHRSSAGGIAGGIVGGIAAISILVAALFFYRQRSRARSAASAANGVSDPYKEWPMSGRETPATTLPGTSTSMMRHYDPDDPTTFPGYQGAQSLPHVPTQVSSSKTLYTVASPPAQEYHGLPIV